MAKDNIIGTYIHGIFDNSEFTSHILNKVKGKGKGLTRSMKISALLNTRTGNMTSCHVKGKSGYKGNIWDNGM